MFQMTSRSLIVGAVALLSAIATPAVSSAHSRPPVSGDRLVVTVRHAGHADGTYVLRCHPGSGSHPSPTRACRALDQRTVWGRDPFASVPPRSMCTMEYGGPATARVTGTWAGRPVDARYDRSNGCQIARWNDLVPLLPDLRSTTPPRRATVGSGWSHG
ncbi:SSI family serine proteinase inhibitor [Streptomyces sp. NPDC048664]|uniref:SSI family serine proteinase inhibitor n=1 Tax=Streptomyces sp. NPDC048664 TaxID=3154505 RepID=UPI00342E2B8C